MILYSFYRLVIDPSFRGFLRRGIGENCSWFWQFRRPAGRHHLVAYANGYVMKNRSKELGLYSVLGMEKKHLLIMTLWELLFFYVLTVGVGLGLGLLFDRLIFALLLKCMGLPVVINQPSR